MGCSPLSAVEQNLQSVEKADGVDPNEAVYIAQKALIDADQMKNFHLNANEILRNHVSRPYKDHWFVHFNPKNYKLNFWRFLVVIEKDSGEVIYARTYIPLEYVDFDWVFEKKQ